MSATSTERLPPVIWCASGAWIWRISHCRPDRSLSVADAVAAADAPGDPANSPLASSPATAARPMRCTTSMFPSSEIDRMRLRVHPWAIASRHVDATVDVNGFADDETRGVRHQESNDLADF